MVKFSKNKRKSFLPESVCCNNSSFSFLMYDWAVSFSFLKSAVDIKKTNYQGFNFFFFLGNRCCNQLSLNREPLVYVLKKKNSSLHKQQRKTGIVWTAGMLWFVNGCVWLPSTRHAYQRALDSKTSTTTSTRFSVLSSARVVILAGKRESRRHSNTSFRENVVVAKTSYQLLGILSFSDRDHSGGEKKAQWSVPGCLECPRPRI